MSASHSPHTVSAPAPRSDRRQLIVSCCIAYARLMIPGLLMIIFLAIPALVPPAFRLDPVSSLSSLNNSTSFVTARWNITLSIKSPHMELLLTFNGERPLSRPSLVSAFSTQGPDNSTSFVTTRWNITLSVKSPHMELLLTFNGQRPLSRPSLVSDFSTQGPDNVTMVRGKALSMLRIEASHGSLTSRCDICLSIGNE